MKFEDLFKIHQDTAKKKKKKGLNGWTNLKVRNIHKALKTSLELLPVFGNYFDEWCLKSGSVLCYLCLLFLFLVRLWTDIQSNT